MATLNYVWLVLLAVPFLSGLTAAGATLCVAPGGANGCYSHIADAVAAANPYDTIRVKAGTYNESILITKPLSLAGDGATIDATGLGRAFL